MRPAIIAMNAKLILKTIFILVMLLLLVMIGMYNRSYVEFSLPPLVKNLRQPSGIMYFAFFAVGLLTGTILTAGKKGGASTGSAKPKPPR